jgi:RimJ/RimL family protein N-acetyltransferase
VPLIAPEPIETARLVVRPVRADDLAALVAVNSDEKVTAMLPYARWASMDDARAWLARMEGIQSGGSAVQFVIVDQALGQAVGTALLFRHDEGSARAELGYVLGRRHWGRGLMHEALGALLERAFTGLGLRRIEAEVDVRNAASSRVLQRLGFVREGILRQRWVTKGEARDVEVHGLLRSEWTAPTHRPCPRRSPTPAAPPLPFA